MVETIKPPCPACDRPWCEGTHFRPPQPEIDEAAAVESANVLATGTRPAGDLGNLARAALAWKARAESEKAEREALELFIRGLNREDREAVDAMKGLRARAESAEAERDSLKRQLAQSVKAR